MTQYLNKSFSVALGSDKFRENYDRVFGKRSRDVPETPKRPRKPRAPLLERRVAERAEHVARQAYGQDAGEND